MTLRVVPSAKSSMDEFNKSMLSMRMKFQQINTVLVGNNHTRLGGLINPKEIYRVKYSDPLTIGGTCLNLVNVKPEADVINSVVFFEYLLNNNILVDFGNIDSNYGCGLLDYFEEHSIPFISLLPEEYREQLIKNIPINDFSKLENILSGTGLVSNVMWDSVIAACSYCPDIGIRLLSNFPTKEEFAIKLSAVPELLKYMTNAVKPLHDFKDLNLNDHLELLRINPVNIIHFVGQEKEAAE